MTIYLMMAEHQIVPGLVIKTCASYAIALRNAIECANIMLKDAGMDLVSDENSMNAAIERLQEEYGAAHCYVDITTHDLLNA